MRGARQERKPTAPEFFASLLFQHSHRPLFRRFYKSLRRRGLGQTCALIGALRALGYKLVKIAPALRGSYRASSRNWAKIRARFSVSCAVELAEFLRDPTARPEGRRSKPTPQQRPFYRLPVAPALKSPIG